MRATQLVPPVPPVPGPAPLTSLDFAARAKAALTPELWDWLEGGAEQELTLAANRAALDGVALTPRVLNDVALCDTSAVLLGQPAALPLALAPVAYQRLFHPDGELASARAAVSAGVPFCVSTLSSTPLEQLAATGAELWFQLYWLKDRGRVAELVGQAERAGCQAIVVTVDVPVMGRRLRDARTGFPRPTQVRAVLLGDTGPQLAHRRTADTSAVAVHTAAAFSQSVTWQDLRWLRERTELPIVVKGVLHPQDAALAAELGAAAVVVSNHGGRQLDRAPASSAALPAVVERLAGSDCQVLVDSGIRTGTDILAALALGASGVLLGRPAIWGLSADGADGAARVLELLGAELRHAMALSGCPDLPAARGLHTTALSG